VSGSPIESAKSVCDSAKAIVDRARQVAASAKKLEAEIVKKLESAEALARTCTTASQAADLREIYRSATYTVSALGSALKNESMQCTRLPGILDDFAGRWARLLDLVDTLDGDSILDDYQAGTTAINVSNEALRSGPDPLAEHTRLLAIATDLQRNSYNILTPQQKIGSVGSVDTHFFPVTFSALSAKILKHLSKASFSPAEILSLLINNCNQQARELQGSGEGNYRL
jgi:hypothetical protein